jgi:sigma-B regulation protein RsbU (phosphoserine phosphatase)
MEQVALLRRVPLLSELPEGVINMLASTLKVVDIESGEVLCRENEPGDSLYIVIEGRVEILLGIETPDEKIITSIGPGEFIGEMSLVLPGGLRTASVRAATPARLWMMTRVDFDALLHRQPTLAYAMVKTLTMRLDSTNVSGFRELQEKNRLLQIAYDELKAAQAQIIEKERLERELQVAAEIQMGILPQNLPRVLGYDFGALMVPARLVGGDFYDVFFLDGNRIGFVIGDVADKGIPSAIFMARVHAFIMAEATHSSDPAGVLRRVNDHLIHLEQSAQFVTVIYGILDIAAGAFTYARAGHELPLAISGDGMVRTLPHNTGQAVGMLEGLILDEHSFSIPPGGTLVLFTDGLTDCRNLQHEPFGYERVAMVLGGQSGRSGQHVCNALWEALQNYQSGSLQDDDVTLVAIHRQ